MSQSDQLFERSKKIVPGGVHSPVRGFTSLGRAPIFFHRGEGCFLYSVDGDKYIDFCQSFGPNILGHRDQDVLEEVQKAVQDGWTYGAADPWSLEFAEWLTEKLPHVEMLRFVNSGTEAVMSALRLARGVTGREKIVKFEGCYHGHVDSMLVKAGSGLAGESASSSAGVGEVAASQTLVVPLGDRQALEDVFNQWGNEIAAVIIEPLPANYGLLVQEKEFLKFISEKTKMNQSLLILDEVISGFRVAFGGMSELWSLEPDLVTFGKIIGGGFPVGCYAGKSQFMSQIAPSGPVYQAGTLSANPVAIRAGQATLKKCLSQDVYSVLETRTQRFCESLDQIFIDNDWALKATQFGSLFWIHGLSEEPIRAISQIPGNQGELFKPLFLKLLDKGIYLAPNAYEVGFLSLAHTEGVLNQVLEKTEEGLRELKREL